MRLFRRHGAQSDRSREGNAMTRALFEARSRTVLDQMIRLGYRGQQGRWLHNSRGVSQETANHEQSPQGRFVSSWRALVRHRITVCCVYGDAWRRTAAIY